MARKPGSRPRGYVVVTPDKAISPVRPAVGTYPTPAPTPTPTPA